MLVRGENIPHELKTYEQWVVWRQVPREKGKKPDKVPCNPKTLGKAGVHWPNTWSTFEQAYTTYLRHRDDGIAGIGFVLADDPFVAVDIDECMSEEGITEPAVEIIQTLQSYTEVSPSGRGLRILATSPDYQENHKSKTTEIYSHSRFVTVTGAHVAGTPDDITTVDPNILKSLLPPQQPATIPTPHESKPFTGTDAQLWEHIFRFDQYGTQHQQRFNGDISLDHGDHSLAVIRLLNTLARWTNGDPVRMRAMMLQSPLSNDKWYSRRGDRDYLDYQIQNAINYVQRRK
jgi:primase-polymerase (primpol)-like protein